MFRYLMFCQSVLYTFLRHLNILNCFLNMKTCICAILLLLIILIKTYSKDLELLCENINIICGIFFILFLPVQNKYKIPFLCLFIWRWNININLFYTMIYIMFNHKQI